MSDEEDIDKTQPLAPYMGQNDINNSQYDDMGNVDEESKEEGENIFGQDSNRGSNIKKMNSLSVYNSRKKPNKRSFAGSIVTDEYVDNGKPMIPRSDVYETNDYDGNHTPKPNTFNILKANTQDFNTEQKDLQNQQNNFIEKQKTLIKAGTFILDVKAEKKFGTEGTQESDSEDDDNEGFSKTFKELDVDDDQFEAQRKDFESIDFQQTMDEFVDKFGSTIEIAGKVVLDSKFFPNDPNYCVQVINYTQPTTNYCVHTHPYQQNSFQEQNFKDLYSEEKYDKKKCVLRILHAESKGTMKTVKEILIPAARKIQLQFSPNCDYMAIYWKQSGRNAIHRLALYKIDAIDEELSIESLFGTFDQIEHLMPMDNVEIQEDMGQNIIFDYNEIDDALLFLEDTKRIKFCVSDSKFLVCYNKNSATVLNIHEEFESVEDRIVKTFLVDSKYFDGIFHLQIDSKEVFNDEGIYCGIGYKCEVACMSAQSNSVVIFDIDKYGDDQENVDVGKSIIIQDKEDTENMNVKISQDFTQVVFTHHAENYMLTESHKCPNTHLMTNFNNKETTCYTCGKDIGEGKEGGEIFKKCLTCQQEKEKMGIFEDLDQCMVCQNTNTSKLCENCEDYAEKQDDCQNEECNQEQDQPIVFLQTKITWMKGKEIRHIAHAGKSDFLFICCKNYDRDLDIESSCYKHFKINIPRQIEPNIIRVFDCFQQNFWTSESVPKLRGIGSNMRIVSMRDDEFFIDDINPLAHYFHIDQNIGLLNDQDKSHLLEEGHLQTTEWQELENTVVLQEFQDESQLQGFSCNTPFLTLAETDQNYQLIFNLNDPTTMHRIQLPSNVKRVVQTWISQTLDLFILCITEDTYELYTIDLDDFHDKINKKRQKFKIKFMMSYERSDETGTSSPLMDFHVRGSSKKEKINLNKKVMAFFMHEKGIYYWHEKMKSNTEVEMVLGESDADGRTKIYSYFDKKNDENLYIASHTLREEDGISQFRFDQIKISFNEYIIQNRHIETEYLNLVKSYAYDFAENVLILLTKSAEKKKNSKKRVKIIELDTEENRTILDMKITNPELIGRLKSQLFFLVNGHMYYNNSLIKIRYDLLRKNTGIGQYQEKEIFDYYENNISLELNERVLAQMPVSQHDAHRLIFMTKNKKSLKRSRIIILPYLHERRLHFGKLKKDCEYFQTAQRYIKFDEQGESTGYKYWLINVNLSDYKYYVYSLNGTLENRVEFKHQVQFYGKPKAVSNNGQVFLFRKDTKGDDGIEEKELTVLWLTPKGLFQMKTIKMREAIMNYIETMEQEFEGQQKDLEQFNDFQTAV